MTDPAFHNAGQTEGVQVWRIEKMQVVPVDQSMYGKFYTGDSYIVLRSYGRPRPGKWDIHFWLGKESSQDEETTAAYKAVELDDLLGGTPVQHRELQGHESQLFMSHFHAQGGIRYLEGGVDSALTKVSEEKFQPRLYHVKGKREVRVTSVPVTVRSLNQGDVFVLDTREDIYVWCGPKCSRVELRKGIQFAQQLRDNEHGGRSMVHVLGESLCAETVNTCTDDDWHSNADFYAALGGSPNDACLIPSDAGDDAQHEMKTKGQMRLFRVSDRSGHVQLQEVVERPLSYKQLDSSDCFILDLGLTGGIYAWVGKNCSKEERRNVWPLARHYLKENNMPDSTPMARVNDGAEEQQFRTALRFPVDLVQAGHTNVYRVDKIANVTQQHDIDVSALHAPLSELAKDEFCPDDGRGNVTVKRVERKFLRPIDKSDYGTFYSGDSYVINYTYAERSGREEGIIYYWHGNHSTQDETAFSALFAVREDEDFFQGRAVQIRVQQNKEPVHFIRMFGGHIVIKHGGIGSGFDNTTQKDYYDTDGTELYQIRNTIVGRENLIRIVQVEEKASSLNSNDVFVLKTPKGVYIWHGKGASEYEKMMSREFAKSVTQLKNPQVFDEGQESNEFWTALGGKTEYATDPILSAPEAVQRPARLFQCSNARGYFHIEEIHNFTQEDLVDDDVMLLDTGGNSIYVWVGAGANEMEKRESLNMAKRYVEADPQRSGTTILVVNQSNEPPNFKGYFGVWDNELAKKRFETAVSFVLEEINQKAHRKRESQTHFSCRRFKRYHS